MPASLRHGLPSRGAAHQSSGAPTALANILVKRQSNGSSDSYDHRWLIFIVPLVLAFFLITGIVWWFVHRRRKRRQRRSSLRNVTLVAADEEKRQDRLSRGNSISSRLSRMTSTKSSRTRSSRAGSRRSAHGRTARESSKRSHGTNALQQPEEGPRTAETDAIGASEEQQMSRAAPGAEVGTGTTTEVMTATTPFEIAPAAARARPSGVEDHGDDDLERHAEASAASPSRDARGPDDDDDDAAHGGKAAHSDREPSGLSVIGESPRGSAIQSTIVSKAPPPSALRKESGVQRQASIRSTDGGIRFEDENGPSSAAPSSAGHTTHSNPFSTPTASSSGHTKLPSADSTSLGAGPPRRASAPPPASETASSNDASNETTASGLVRKLSNVVRLQQPQPSLIHAKTGPMSSRRPPPARRPSQGILQRSDSRSSRKSSVRSSRREGGLESVQIQRTPSTASSVQRFSSGAGTPVGNWTYTSRAHEWRSSSSGAVGAAPGGASATNEPLATETETGPDAAEVAAAIKSNTSLVVPPRAQATPSPDPSRETSRQASLGASGSRFVETF